MSPFHPLAPAAGAAPSSVFLSALTNIPPPVFSPNEPPPYYDPYPYNRTWDLEYVVSEETANIMRRREDTWTRYADGRRNKELEHRIWSTLTWGIQAKQRAAKKKHEDDEAFEKAPPVPRRRTPLLEERAEPAELVDNRFDFDFKTVDGKKGIPMKTLMSGRRAIENMMDSAKEKVFENYSMENIWVRTKWPAYPEHEPVRLVPVTARMSKKGRRPCRRLEIAVTLTSLITKFYDEVSKVEPVLPHLALGSGPGRISLFQLRMIGLRASARGIYELILEQDEDEVAKAEPDVAEEQVEAKEEQEDTQVRIYDAPWPSHMIVPCYLAPPPKVTMNDYLAHVNPLQMATRPLPVWRESDE